MIRLEALRRRASFNRSNSYSLAFNRPLSTSVATSSKRSLTDIQDQRSFLASLQQRLNINDWQDWYKQNKKSIIENGGRSLLERYDDSPSLMITTLLPEHQWQMWKFSTVPKGFWRDTKNQRNFLEWLATNLQYKTWEDWYGVTQNVIEQNGGASLLRLYHDSPPLLITSVFPEHNWLMWRFQVVPKGFWQDEKNQRKFMEWLYNKLELKSWEDWYSVTRKSIAEHGGNGVLALHNHSPSQAITAIFPEHPWLQWRFNQVATGYWKSISNQRKFLEWLGTQLNVKNMEDWYSVSSENIVSYGGASLLKTYNSYCEMIMSVFAEYPWKIWKFKQLPKGYISKLKTDPAEQKRFLEYFKSCENIKSDEELLFATLNLVEKYISGLSSTEFIEIVLQTYPNLRKQSIPAFGKTQQIAAHYITQLFPNEEININYLHPSLINPVTNSKLELDIYLPSKKLAFEYQGKQHYESVSAFQSVSVENVQSHDTQKIELCKQAGITLIEIPYWWDLSIESLVATIQKERPDLFLERNAGTPIPASKPVKKITKDLSADKILTLAGSHWEKSSDPTGWWVSEKYDGVRCYWNGQELISRNNKVIKAPKWFVQKLPQGVQLDGELWVDRGKFYQASTLLLPWANISHWEDVKFLVFDYVNNELPFEERYEFLKSLQVPTFVQIVEHVKCTGKDNLMDIFKDVKSKKGEGLMLRKPHSLYKPGRTQDLLKYKGYLDTEVKVIIRGEKGLVCEQLNGLKINVRCSPHIRETCLPGTVITVKYEGLNDKGELHFNHFAPVFVRTRNDVTWSQCVVRFVQDGGKL